MEDQAIEGERSSRNRGREMKLEEEEGDFCSCCGDEAWKEAGEMVKEDLLNEFSAKMFFKGVSVAESGGSSGLSGIGVVIERSENFPLIQVQKKFDFFMEESVAEYLALMDGLTEVTKNNVRQVYAFTDSKLLYDQMTHEEQLDVPLLGALRQRVLARVSEFEAFVVNLVSSSDLIRPLHLAQVAVGLVFPPNSGNNSCHNCSICCEDKLVAMMITLKCSHKFCSHCMRTYVDGKVKSSQVPIRCPQVNCKHSISTAEFKLFLPISSYESLEEAFAEADVLHSDRFYCPYPNCSVLLDPRECLPSARTSSSSQSGMCPVCQRFICVECGVPWHSSMSCEEFQNLPLEERDAADITLHQLAQNKRWRRCQQCRRMIELTQGCYHMTCWCGHEFCYSCGCEYREGRQTCQCALWHDNSENLATQSVQESEQWAWESFNSLPMMMDAYTEQERSQLALVQQFLAGGFSLSDHRSYQSPPRCTDSYADVMKDLHQLPWLERFVSVVTDNYYEDYYMQ